MDKASPGQPGAKSQARAASSLKARPKWLRAFVVSIALSFLLVGGFAFSRHLSEPVTLTIAAGLGDGDVVETTTAIAKRLSTTKSHVRLKVLETNNILASAQAFAAGDAEVAVVRADVGDLAAART